MTQQNVTRTVECTLYIYTDPVTTHGQQVRIYAYKRITCYMFDTPSFEPINDIEAQRINFQFI